MRRSSLPFLMLADDIKLSSLYGWTWDWVEMEAITFLLAQTSDLEFLSMQILMEIRSSERTLKNLASEIIRHRQTLRVLNLTEEIFHVTEDGAWLWDIHIVKAIKSCKKLVDLSLTICADRLPCYYLSLIQSLPDLVNLTIYNGRVYNDHWSHNSIRKLFKAAEQLESIVFKDQCPDFSHRTCRYRRKASLVRKM